MKEIIIGKFQGGENFGFLIPFDREYYGGDFFVSKKNFFGAMDGDKVEGIEIKTKGKKPEVKILKIYGKEKNNKNEFYIEGIYNEMNKDFGFIDIEGQEKGYFVYSKNKNNAINGDIVKAQVIEFKGKKEAIIVKIIKNDFEIVEGIYKDNDTFGFVLTKDKGDIFIPGVKKFGALDGDIVQARIIKMGKKNKEGVIIKILGK